MAKRYRRRNPAATIGAFVAGHKLLVAGGALAVAYFWKKKPATSSLISLTPAPVKAGQAVTVESYRVIKDRRAGMEYIQATGQPGAKLGFTPPRDGIFTRNTVVEAGLVFAELK